MHNNYILTREGNFITVSDDELYHYKYVKREKVNGKWRYYYKDTKVDKAAANAAKATDAYENAVEVRTRHWDNMMSKLHKVDDETFDRDQESWHRSARKAIDAETNKRQADREYEQAKKKYDESAGHKVADLLNKSQDKIDNAKKWVNNLLTKKKK